MSKKTDQWFSVLLTSLALGVLSSSACEKAKDSPEQVEEKRKDEVRDAVAKYCDLARECFPGEKMPECEGTSLLDELDVIRKQHSEETYSSAITLVKCRSELNCTQLSSPSDDSGKGKPCMEEYERFEELFKTIKCSDGELVEGEYCDSKKQCKDASDEHRDSCFACDDTISIPKHYVCDGKPNCSPKPGEDSVAADEADCPEK